MNVENYSPMLRQYLDMKKTLNDTLLFFRLGDFYELFFEDAKIAANELDLVLTSRAAGNNQKAPMCGVPHHAVQSYLQRLINKGYKVAIAEQVEDPATAKGLVKREIVKIVTPGLNLEQEEDSISTIASVERDLINFHLVIFNLNNNHIEQVTIHNDIETLLLNLYQHNVVEVILDDSDLMKSLASKSSLILSQQTIDDNRKSSKMEVANKRLIAYLEYTQKQKVKPIEVENQLQFMHLDYSTTVNLELFESIRQQSKKNTLWSYLDKTNTSMGSRQLRRWISRPLYKVEDILERQEKIEYLIEHFLIRHQMSEILKKVYDLEKITTKISYGSVNAQDLLRLKSSLLATTDLMALLKESPLTEITQMPDVEDLLNLLEDTLHEQAPINLKDGNTIKEGFNEKLDDYRWLIDRANEWLLEYEAKEKEKTGIKNLRVGFTRAFGYYIEVSKSQTSMVKEEFGYKRRQTLTSGERYITLDLKEQEEKINEATENILQLETKIFDELIEKCKQYTLFLDDVATRLANSDVLYGLSEISSQKGYVKPVFHQKKKIEVKESYHPILEMTLKQHEIIANDIQLSEDDDVMILTGPNMGGKSTYMRQVALLIIMAQMGCYVRAKSAKLPLFDAIYTRMGASDDIMMGQSTFMIEMSEANHALTNATNESLILFDEIGRGTSTYDGMAIAQAIIEYIALNIKAKCIFSTHYHEITHLEESLENVVNYKVDVLEEDDKVTFLYRVTKGKADKSYGLHVARLAQLPYPLISRANEHLKDFENNSISESTQETVIVQSPLEKELVYEIQRQNIDNMTPLQAQALLVSLQKKIKEHQDE